MRILIADDHALFRDSLQSLLSTGDYDVVGEAADGAEAVRLAWELKPDVVLMDLAMPGVDGLEATKQLAAELPEVKVVVLTGTDQGPTSAAWVRWWNDHRKGLVIAPDLPELPRPMLERWVYYWGLDRELLARADAQTLRADRRGALHLRGDGVRSGGAFAAADADLVAPARGHVEPPQPDNRLRLMTSIASKNFMIESSCFRLNCSQRA